MKKIAEERKKAEEALQKSNEELGILHKELEEKSKKSNS